MAAGPAGASFWELMYIQNVNKSSYLEFSLQNTEQKQ